MVSVPPHQPRFAVVKCSDGRLQLVLKHVFKDSAPGLFFKIINAGPLLPPYIFHLLIQHPLEILAGSLLKFCSVIRLRILESRYGQSDKAKLRLERFVHRAHYALGWLALSGTYGAFRYAICYKGVRNTIIVVHEACGAHEENLGPHGKDLWNRTIKENALGTMKKLKSLPESKAVESWHLWYVSFSKRGIQTFDHESQTWKVMTVADIEQVLGSKLDVTTIDQLYSEIWNDPVMDGHSDHAADVHTH